MSRKKKIPLNWGLIILLVIIIIYMVSPIDLMPLAEFDDVLAGLIGFPIVYTLGTRRK